MKKTIITAAFLSALLMLTSCGGINDSEKSEDSSVPETTTVSEEATEKAETEEATTETSAEEVTTEPVEVITEELEAEPNFDSIAGMWYIDGDYSLASMYIEKDGTFKTCYADGNLENEGTIRYEDEEIDGTIIHWYVLYDKNDEMIMGFVDDGSESKTDIYIGNGGYPHYQKIGVGGIADDGRGPGEEFVGVWGCGRATLEIGQITDTDFQAFIYWADSAFAHVEWEYPLTYQDGKLVCDGKCTKSYVKYSAEPSEPDESEVIYTDGSAEFVMQGSNIVWNDLTEQSGEGMLFSNSLPK